MARPAGDSSDEEDYYNDNNVNLLYYQQNRVDEEDDLSKLYSSIVNNNVDAVKRLLDKGLDANVVLRDNWTPLLLAASVGDSVISRELITRGANVNAQRDMFTVLMAACNCPLTTASSDKIADIISMLIDKGVNVNLTTRKRVSALMYAAYNGNDDAVDLLLPLSEKDAADNQGWTPIFWAVHGNKSSTVEKLLNAGVDLTPIDVRGQTIQNFVQSFDNEKLFELFEIKVGNEHTDNILHDNVQTYEDLFANLTPNKPTFLDDVACLLYGMKCESLIKMFRERQVDLSAFLALNDKNLLDLGVVFPFQRKRILFGLYQFHKYPYKQKSLPYLRQDAIYSTIDISRTITTCARQIVTMEGSIYYLINNINFEERANFLQIDLSLLKKAMVDIKKTVKCLDDCVMQWDSEVPIADLITKDSLKNRKSRKGKLVLITGILAIGLSLFLYRKMHH